MSGLAIGLLAGALPVHATPSTRPVASPGPDAQRPCPEGLERFLPGEYYYCVAVRQLARRQYGKGLDTLKTAAAWGSKPAQYVLGLSYYRGDIGAADRPLGLAWLALAAERRNPDYAVAFRSAWQLASEGEHQRANALWRELRPTYGDAYAAPRAEARYRRARADLLKDEHNGAQVCIGGLTVDQIPPPSRPRPGQLADIMNPCPGALPAGLAARQLDGYADDLLDGWAGHVQVGPLRTVAGPDR
jgi:hypothetical protein